ncbi:MAG: hypothetical protein NC452_19385 [Eubacterium sp.]|nr:hypothetical protein [Eubacterium sp.]
MKKIIYVILAAVLILSLCSCSSSNSNGAQKDSIISWGTTWYEDGMFYETQNSYGENVLCFYSKDSDRSAVMCGLPECTHVSKTSPDCGALMDSGTVSRCGFNRIGDKLYFIAVQSFSENATGSVDLIKCDINGRNRRIAASLENTSLPFITDVQYSDDHVLIAYYQNFDVEKNETTGLYEFVYLDKYRFYIKQMEISTGKIETLVYREEYDGYGGGAVYGDNLYYNYRYHAEAPTGEMLTPETAPEMYGGFYIRDLLTGDEKEYENMIVFGAALGHFSPDRMIARDWKNGKLCRFDSETDAFIEIADYNLGSYTEDEKDAVFAQNDEAEFWIKYNFESGELSQIPCCENNKISPSCTHTVGNTVWAELSDSDGKRLYAYMDRADFFAGNFENIKTVKEVELQ